MRISLKTGERGSPPAPMEGARVLLRRLGWLATMGFLLNGNWEWLQTPFYDERTMSVNRIVWNRLHCAVADVLILLGCALALIGLQRGSAWLSKPERRHFLFLSGLGTAYTALSEQINAGVRGTWTYSELMPVLPGTAIGLLPLLQWILLPPAAAWMSSRLSR